LFAALFDPPAHSKVRQHSIKQTTFGSIAQKATMKFTSHGKIKSCIRDVQTYGIFPINARPDGIGCLPIG